MSANQPRATLPRLWQPNQPVFWLGAVLCVLFGGYTLLNLAFGFSGVGSMVAGLILMVVQGAILWAVLRLLPRFRRQPRSLQLAALAWGATAAIGLAMIANTPYSSPLESLGLGAFSASLTAPVNEDAFRLLGVLIVLVLGYGKRITVMDGVVYGFLVGLGFELIENLVYAFAGGDFAGTVQAGLTRLTLGLGLHSFWAAIGGAGLAYCLSRRQLGLNGRWWVLLLAVPVSMLLHAAWDAPEISVFQGIALLVFFLLYLITLGVFLIAVKWGRKSEFAWFTDTRGSALSYRAFTRLARADRKRLAVEAVAAEQMALSAALQLSVEVDSVTEAEQIEVATQLDEAAQLDHAASVGETLPPANTEPGDTNSA